MNNEQNRDLNVALTTLENCVSELASQIEVLEVKEGFPTETNYDGILQITMHVVTAARHMTEALKTISADANLQPPESVMGAARKVNLEYSHTEKDEIARIALISANCILDSHNKLVGYAEAEVADFCYKIMNEEN